MKHILIRTAFFILLNNVVYADNPAPANDAAEQPATEQEQTQQQAVASETIDCHYEIPADQNEIAPAVLKAWSKHAATQAFNFNAATLDKQLEALKACFTKTGWQGYEEALQQSGNIDAIKSQNLTVSSEPDGDIEINPVKDNQWKANIPLQVVYQNNKEKLTQKLIVNMLIGRKISGELGIMQIIAAPHSPQETGSAPKPEQSRQHSPEE